MEVTEEIVKVKMLKVVLGKSQLGYAKDALDYINILEKQLAIPSFIPRTCSTCGHREGNMCMKSGYRTETERLHPTECGKNFESWTKRLSITERFRFWWYGG